MNLDSAVFYTEDVEKVIPFYRDILGFKMIDHQDGKFVSFEFSNGAKLGIKTRKEEREIPGHQTVFISVDDIDAEYSRLKKYDIVFAKELVVNPWGTEFSVLDDDGNKILYIKRAE